MTTNEIAVKQILEDYYRAFSTLDIGAILPYFHEPALFIGPSGVFPVPTSAVLTSVLGSTIEDLRAKGYGRSELEQVGVTYLLHKTETGWKIAVLVLHDVG